MESMSEEIIRGDLPMQHSEMGPLVTVTPVTTITHHYNIITAIDDKGCTIIYATPKILTDESTCG